MKVICALLCLAVVAHAANLQRSARNTEAIIPSIVEEILKVELKSDLKKNSAVEVDEKEPLVKDEIIVEPIASRTVDEPSPVVVEEKTPVVVETIVESVPSVRTVLSDEKMMPEMIEKVEIVAVETMPEKPVDNVRTESEPIVAEIVKETVVFEPAPPAAALAAVDEVRKEPEVVAEVVIKEEEIIKPMVRNVIKEEIPQVEELRVIPDMDMAAAVKDTIPEPVASSNIVQPVVEVEPQVKTIVIETIKEEIPMMMMMNEETKMEVKSVPEMIMMKATEEMPEVKAAVVSAPAMPEMMEEKKEEPAMIKDEVKAVVPEEEMIKKVETVEKMMEEETAGPAAKDVDGRQNIIQQIGQQAVNTLSQVPVIGPIVQRITPTTEAAAADVPAADGAEAPLEGEAPVTAADATTRQPNIVQQLISNVQNTAQNLFAGTNNAAVSDTSEGGNRPNIVEQIQQGVSTFVTNVQTNLANLGTQVQSVIRPTQSPTKTDEKPEDAPAEPVAEAEAGKSVEPQPAVIEPEPIVEKKEELPVEKIENVEKQQS